MKYIYIFGWLFFFSVKLSLLTLHGNQSNINFNHISIDQRLPGESVHAIFQDNKGIIWLGIESIGLCKYNGESFTIYENNPQDPNTLSNNIITSIAEDSSSNLWIGTTNGLNVFNKKDNSFKRYFFSQNKNGIPNNYINDIYIDCYNNIWIATRKGLSKYIPHLNKFFTISSKSIEDKTFESSVISDFYVDESKNIWIGSYSSGLYKIDHSDNSRHNADPNYKLTFSKHWLPIEKNEKKLANLAIQQIARYDANTLMLGKFDGLFLFNMITETFSRYQVSINPLINFDAISALHTDKTGKIWVGYSNKGLLVINPTNSTQLYFSATKNNLNGLRSNTIRAIYEDNSGLIWIGTKFQGIHTYNSKQEIFNKHPYNAILDEYLIDKFVISILEDSKRNIWIGTKNNGLFLFNPKNNSIRNIDFSNSINKTCSANNRIECIVEDAFGNIWLGTERGVVKLDHNYSNYYCYNTYFIRCMVADKEGNLWIGTNSSGIFYYNYKKDEIARFSSIMDWDLFKSNSFGSRAINITADSLLWISTFQNGLFKYNLLSNNVTLYVNKLNDSTSLSGNMPRGVFEDNLGRIWIGSKSDGISIYNSQSDNFTRIPKAYDLPPGTVFNFIQDKKNNYWMGTQKGLLKYAPDSNTYTLFDKTHGLKSNIFEVNAICRTHDNLLIFGGNEGLNVFDPTKVIDLKSKAPLIISSVKVLDKIIEENINKYTELKISYSSNYISIEFALTDYSDPLKTHYKYKLEGFDDSWRENDTRNFATYTSLPPGEYYFKLNASQSNNNNWLTKPLIIKIIIVSPFWRKPVFIIGCIIFILIISIIGYIARLNFIRKNELKLRKLVAEKTRNLTELNQELKEHKENLEGIVKQRTFDLEESRKKAVESDKLKSAFLANMSHEIRTPLNAVIGLSNILVTELPPDSENIQLGEMIESNAKALQQLIDDIIDISKIEANQIKIYNDIFPLNACINNIAKIYINHINLYREIINIDIKVNVPENDMCIVSDQIRIEQILKNLINNSLKFTDKGHIEIGYIIVKSEDKKDKIRFFIKDTGIGIPEADLNKIFDRFIKSESRENILYGGTGLGLSICYNLSKLMGGRMWVESKVNEGSQFYFELPLLQDENTNTKEFTESNKLNYNYNWEDKHVLIAEDKEANFFVLGAILRKSKIKIVRAKTGLEAVTEVIKEGGKHIDIVLMDINMPEMDGVEATKQIKLFNRSIPIIAQTAYAMDHEEKEILKSGFDDYVSKPINEQILLFKIARYLE